MKQLSLVNNVKPSTKGRIRPLAQKSKTMKNHFVKDFQSGDKLSNELLAVKSVRKGKTADGRDYVDLGLADKSGEIAGKIWADSLPHCDTVVEGDVVSICATVDEYRDKQQLKITFLQKTDSFDIADFLPTTSCDIGELWKTIDSTVSKIENKSLRALVEHFFADESFAEKFKRAPGAERVHHAYLGGLMEHTAQMVNSAEATLRDFPDMDKDLLLTGVLLHDIGKMDELAATHVIYRTLDGNLIGHVSIGAMTIDKAIDKIKKFPEKLRAKLLNMILGHHGRLEFGSPILPMTREAIALHYIDNLSAKANQADIAVRENQNGQQAFTDKIFTLDTKLYLE